MSEETENQRKPIIGQSVHYTDYGKKGEKYPPDHQAAIITGVNDDGTVALQVFYKAGGLFDVSHCEQSETYQNGTWTWPPFINRCKEGGGCRP